MRRARPAGRRDLLFIAIGFLVSGCGSGRLSAGRLSRAFAATFANLIASQEALLGRPWLDPTAFGATATCRKLAGSPAPPHAQSGSEEGSGTWECTAVWSIPGRRGALRDTYEVTVTPDGCYTATADARESHVGGATVTTKEGASVTNLLYVFDGCFDTSGLAL